MICNLVSQLSELRKSLELPQQAVGIEGNSAALC